VCTSTAKAAGSVKTRPSLPYAPTLTSLSENVNVATSHYNGLQFKLDKRFSNGMQALVTYSYSHLLDTPSGDNYGGTSSENDLCRPDSGSGDDELPVESLTRAFAPQLRASLENDPAIAPAKKDFERGAEAFPDDHQPARAIPSLDKVVKHYPDWRSFARPSAYNRKTPRPATTRLAC
jgi:hypothetical protein